MMDRPQNYPSRYELVKDLIKIDYPYSMKEEGWASAYDISARDMLLLQAASKGSGNVLEAYKTVLKIGYKAINKNFTSYGGAPYFLSINEYLNIIRPVNGVLARLGLLKPNCSLKYPHQLGSHIRTMAQSQTNIIARNPVHIAPLAADLVTNIHPVLHKLVDNFIGIIKSFSYITLPGTHYGSFQQIINLLSGSGEIYLHVLNDCFKKLHKLSLENVEFSSLVKNRVQHLSLSTIEGCASLGSVNVISSIVKSYSDDVNYYESVLINAFENFSFSGEFITKMRSQLTSGAESSQSEASSSVDGVIEAALGASSIDILYPGTGWVDDGYGRVCVDGFVARAVAENSKGVTRLAHVADTKTFSPVQPPNQSPDIVSPPFSGGTDINLNPFFIKKSSKRSFVQDYKERVPQMPDHLLVGGEGGGKQN